MIVLNYVVLSIILHGATVQGAVLFDDSPAVDAYDFPVREGFANDVHSLCVKIGLIIGWYQYGTINDQIVGIGGRQPVFAIIDGAGQRQL